MTIQELKKVVKNLSPKERLLLVQYVLGTLTNETDVDLFDKWENEMEVRSVKYKDGGAKTRSWDEVKERLIRKYS